MSTVLTLLCGGVCVVLIPYDRYVPAVLILWYGGTGNFHYNVWHECVYSSHSVVCIRAVSYTHLTLPTIVGV